MDAFVEGMGGNGNFLKSLSFSVAYVRRIFFLVWKQTIWALAGEGNPLAGRGRGGRGSVKFMFDSYVSLLLPLAWLLGSLKFPTILLPSLFILLIVSDFHASSQSKPFPSHCRIPINPICRRGPWR